MKYLGSFYNYIKESKEIDKDKLEDMLLPLEDMGIRYVIFEGILVGTKPGDVNHGRKYIDIHVSLDILKTSELITRSKNTFIDDNRFWELLDELLAIRGRMLESGLTNCVVNFSNAEHNSYISLLLIGDKDVSDIGKLTELHSRIASTLNNMKSDFSYNTYSRLYIEYPKNQHISIVSGASEYTERKFMNLMNRSMQNSDISLSDFNIEKTHVDRDGNYSTREMIIKITLK
jgi:hypothetical protein